MTKDAQLQNPTSVADLKKWLQQIPPGPIEKARKLESLLAACWSQLNGGDAGGMEAYKLHDRIEAPRWEPPLVRFQIERHGAAVKGSSRAEIQEWSIDVDQGVATLIKDRFRQIKIRSKTFDVIAAVNEVVDLVKTGVEDRRISRNGDGTLLVNVSKVVPELCLPKQTLADRRKRFREALKHALKILGWHEMPKSYRFAKGDAKLP